jgi:antitoxin ParD1/3/4
MTRSLHVSLPDEMRQFVDHRTNGKKVFSTPSEYVRALIRDDMEKEAERLYVFKTLLQSADDIEHGRMQPSSALEAVQAGVMKRLRAKAGE